MLIKCEDCGKEYSVTLKNCPQCGRKRPFKKKCLTCGAETMVSFPLCEHCGFPYNENHKMVTMDPGELQKQEELIQALVQEVEQKKAEFKDALFTYKESYLKNWLLEVENQIQEITNQIKTLEQEKNTAGVFAFAKKTGLKKEIEELQKKIEVFQESKGAYYERVVRVTNWRFDDQTKDDRSWISSRSDDGKFNYISSLEASLTREIHQLKRYSSQYTIRCELIKDIAVDILLKQKKPMKEENLIEEIKKQNPDFSDLVPRVFIERFQELRKEGRVIVQMGRESADSSSSLRNYYRVYYDFSTDAPDLASVLDYESKQNQGEQVIGKLKEKYGAGYNQYMNNLAASVGFDVFRNAECVSYNDSIRRGAVAAMGAMINAQAAVRYSKKTDAVLAGGLAAGLTTPMVGAYVHYKVTQDNRHKDELRKQAEIDRDSWIRKYQLSTVNTEWTNLDRFDFELLKFIESKKGKE